jgi:RecA-family ATPase
MAQEYEPLQFAVEKILPHGLFILAGSGKIGKSWLSLDLCVNVAMGSKLWEFSSDRGDVL